MKNSFEWLLGWRYTRASRGVSHNRFISFISALSMVGIVLGVMALIVVISVMNGFQKEVRERNLSVVPHIQVFPSQGAPQNWYTALTQQMKTNPEILGAAPYMSSPSIILQDGEMVSIQVEGIAPAQEANVSQVPQKIIAGSLDALTPQSFNVVLGVELARKLGLELEDGQFALGQTVTVIAPEVDETIAGVMPRMRAFNVVGIVKSGQYQIDSNFAYTNVNDAVSLFRASSQGRVGLRVKVADIDRAPQTSDWIVENAGMAVDTKDWTSFNKEWFSAVKTEKVMMIIILLFITMVAGFNLVSMLVMTVNEKQADIAILRTQGASKRSIMRIFMLQGALIGGMGTLIGMGLGVLLASNIGSIVRGIEIALNIDVLPKGIYLIERMPSDVRVGEVLTIALVSFGLSLLATIYPSRKAANVEPARALRYE
jgi:lipoprotein-releasing system permease protein